MVAVDAIVVYIQSTPNFPSWTSRVRSRLPLSSFQVVVARVRTLTYFLLHVILWFYGYRFFQHVFSF